MQSAADDKANPARKIILKILYIITAALIAAALIMAVFTGFSIGLRGLYHAGLPGLTGELIRHPRLVLVIMTVLLFIFLMAAGSWIDHGERKGRIAAAIVMTAFMIGMQIWIIFGLNIIQNTDSFEVQDQAMAIARGFMKSVDYEKSAYFRKYGNNDLYLIMCIGMYRLCDALHIENWSKFFAIFNTFCIDAGIMMCCRIIAALKNEKTALKAYLISVLNPLNYLFIHWTYTCTYSIPLMMLSVLLAVYVRRHKKPGLRPAIAFIFIGITAVIGYYLRPTAVFPIIALLIVAVLDHLPAGKNGKKHDYDAENFRIGAKNVTSYDSETDNDEKRWRRKTSARNIFYKTIVVILALAIMAGMAKLIKNDAARYNTDTEYNFPIEHWLMVGITGTGRLTGEDMKYTASFKTKEEKAEADRAAIKEALNERGALGTFIFFIGKIGVTWADGTDEYYLRTTQSENSDKVLYQLISGARRGAIMLYSQAFRIILLLLAAAGIIREIRESRFDSGFAVFVITVLGGLVFYMFWEGKPVYSLPFMQFLVLPACNAWNPLSRVYYKNVEMGRSRRVLITERASIGLIMALVTALFVSDSTRILGGQTYTTWSIVCSSPAIKEYVEIDPGETMEQEFYPAYSFNRILFVAKKTSEEDCRYGITLSRGEETLAYFEMQSSDISRRRVVLSFDDIKPAHSEMYKLTIENLSKNKNSVSFAVRKCYISSQYRGERYLGGTQQVGDTLIDVYEAEKAH